MSDVYLYVIMYKCGDIDFLWAVLWYVLFPSQKMIKLISIHQFYLEENKLLYVDHNKYQGIKYLLKRC